MLEEIEEERSTEGGLSKGSEGSLGTFFGQYIQTLIFRYVWL